MRWALLGASDIAATQVIPALRACGQEPAIVVSGDIARAATYAAENGIASFSSDINSALKDVQAAYVSSTNEKHFAQTMAAIEAGLHVLCEKPLAMTGAEAQQMISAAQAAGVVLATNHHLRNSAVLRTMRDLIAAGEIGDLLAVRVAHAVILPERLRGWRLDNPAAGGGVMLDITVHDADTIRFVTGLEPTAITAVGASQGLGHGIPDAVMTSGLLDDRVLFSTHDAFTVPHADTGFEAHGTLGSLVGRGCMTPAPVGTLDLLRDGETEPVSLPVVDSLYEPNIAAFISAVDGRGEPLASGDDGRRSLLIALGAVQSLETGRTVTLQLEAQTPSEV
jgi:1,5-anhydro-D-fructose reductase (1,5-anhydro-D-mannitol-forming)